MNTFKNSLRVTSIDDNEQESATTITSSKVSTGTLNATTVNAAGGITTSTINGCTINPIIGDVITRPAIPVVKEDKSMEIGEKLDFHSKYESENENEDGSAKEDYKIRVDCSNSMFAINAPLDISTGDSSSLTAIKYHSTKNFGTNRGCRISIGEKSEHAAYFGFWNGSTDEGQYAYMKRETLNGADVRTYADRIQLTGTTRIYGATSINNNLAVTGTLEVLNDASFTNITTTGTINGCTINPNSGINTITRPAIPIIRSGDGIMEIGQYLDFHTAYDGTQNYGVRIGCNNSKFDLSAPIYIHKNIGNESLTAIEFKSTNDFQNGTGCRIAIGDPTRSAYFGCWKNDGGDYFAYMKLDGDRPAIGIFENKIELGTNTEINGTLHVKHDIAVYGDTFNNQVSYTADATNIEEHTIIQLYMNDTISGTFKWFKFSPTYDSTDVLLISNTLQQDITSPIISNVYNPIFKITFDNSASDTIKRSLIMIVNEKEYGIQIAVDIEENSFIYVRFNDLLYLNYNETYYDSAHVYTLPFNFYVKDNCIYIQFKNDALYDKIGVKLMDFYIGDTIYSKVIYNKTPISDCVYMDNNIVKAKSIIVSGTPVENLMMTFYAADVVDNLLQPDHYYAFMVDKNVHEYENSQLYMVDGPYLWNPDITSNNYYKIFWYYDSEHRLYRKDDGNYYITLDTSESTLRARYIGLRAPSSSYKIMHIGLNSLGFLYDLDDPRYVFGYQQDAITPDDEKKLRLCTLNNLKALVWSYVKDPSIPVPSTSIDLSAFTSAYAENAESTPRIVKNHNAENKSIINVLIYTSMSAELTDSFDSIQSFECYNKFNDNFVLQEVISGDDASSYITYEGADNINVLNVMYATMKKWTISDDVAASYDKVKVIDVNGNVMAELINDKSKADFGKIRVPMVNAGNILTDEIDVKHIYAEDAHIDIFTTNDISFKPCKYAITPVITFNNDYFIFEFDSTAKTFTFGINTNANFDTMDISELVINVYGSFYLDSSGSSPGMNLQVIYNKPSNQFRAGIYFAESTSPTPETTFTYNGIDGYWYTSNDCSKIIIYHPNYSFLITPDSLPSNVNSIKPTAGLITTPPGSINVNFNVESVQGNVSIGEENISDVSKRIAIITDTANNTTIFKTPSLQIGSTQITATKVNNEDPDSLNVYQLSRNGHTHVVSDVTGLQAALDDKANVNHTHTSFTDITVNTINECSINSSIASLGSVPSIPIIKASGIMEIGKVLHFHIPNYPNNRDFDFCIHCDKNGVMRIYTPTVDNDTSKQVRITYDNNDSALKLSTPILQVGNTVVKAEKQDESDVSEINLCKINDTYTNYKILLTTINGTDGGYCYIHNNDELGITVEVIKNYPAFVIIPTVETFEIDAHTIDSNTTSYTDSNNITYFVMRNGENITVIMSTTKALASSKNIVVTLDSTFSVTITLNTAVEKFINISTDEGKAIISSAAPTFGSNNNNNINNNNINTDHLRVKHDIAVYDGVFNNQVSYVEATDNIEGGTTAIQLCTDDTIPGTFQQYQFSLTLDEEIGGSALSIHNLSQQVITSPIISNVYNPVFKITFDNSASETIVRFLIMIVNEKEYEISITVDVVANSSISVTLGNYIHLNYNETFHDNAYVYTLPFNFYVKDNCIYIQFKNDVLYDKIGVKLTNFSNNNAILSRVIYNKTPSDCVYMNNDVVKAKSIIVSGMPFENLMMTFYAADVVDNLLVSNSAYRFEIDVNVYGYTYLGMCSGPKLWTSDKRVTWYYDLEHRLSLFTSANGSYIARNEKYSSTLAMIDDGSSPMIMHIGLNSLGFLYNLDDPRYVFGYQQDTLSNSDLPLKLYTLGQSKTLIWEYAAQTFEDSYNYTSVYATNSTTSSFVANAENKSITSVSIYKQSAAEPNVTYDSIQSFKCYNKFNDNFVLQNIISNVAPYITYEHGDNIDVLNVMYANVKRWIINDNVADSYDKVEVIDANDNVMAELINDRSKADFGKICAPMMNVKQITATNITVDTINGCSINATSNNVIAPTIPVVKANDGTMEIGSSLNFHTKYDDSNNQDNIFSVDCRNSKFALNAPIYVHTPGPTTPTEATTVFSYQATSAFDYNQGCRITLGDTKRSAIVGCWKELDISFDNYYAYFKRDGSSSPEVRAYGNKIMITGDTLISGDISTINITTNGTITADEIMLRKNNTEHNIFDLIYPVGSVYISTINVNPSNYFGGLWDTVVMTGFYAWKRITLN